TASFSVTAASMADSQSGIQKVNFPAVSGGSGMTGGGDVLSPGPYSATYTWSATTTSSGSQTVNAYNNAGLTTGANFTLTPDTTFPSANQPTVTTGYYTTLSVPVSGLGGSDGGSGIDGSSGILERETATLSNGSCTGWGGSWTTVTLSSGNDTGVTTGNCYHYRYKISDNV